MKCRANPCWTIVICEQRPPNNMGAIARPALIGCLVGGGLSLLIVCPVQGQNSGPQQLQRRDGSSVQKPVVPRDFLEQSAERPAEVRRILSAEKAPDERLEDIDKALKKAEDTRRQLRERAEGLDGDIKKLRQGMVGAARLIQDHEKRVDELTKQLAQVDQELAVKESVLRKRRKQMGGVLQALQRIAQYPPEALIAQPISPGDTVRTAILLRSSMPELARRALLLRDDLSALQLTKSEAQRRREELNEAATELEGQRKMLRTLLGRKSRLRRRTVVQTDEADRKAKALAVEARSLRDLMQRLEVLRQEREEQAKAQQMAKKGGEKPAVAASGPPPDYSGKPIDIAKGKLPFPVIGQVQDVFGEAAPSGLTHKGITIDTVSEAQVIVPYEGRVAFTGPFRGYGRLLIIEHGAGYHTLLAGMGRIDVAVGQWVLGGEPVGIMDRVSTNQKRRKPSLYLELRHEGQPINPLPWLAARDNQIEKSKVSG